MRRSTMKYNKQQYNEKVIHEEIYFRKKNGFIIISKPFSIATFDSSATQLLFMCYSTYFKENPKHRKMGYMLLYMRKNCPDN